MQCGHFISRRHYITRWKETNAKPQCYSCNVGNQGMQYQFALNLNKEYGYDIAQELLQESKQSVKLSNEDLVSLINRYIMSITRERNVFCSEYANTVSQQYKYSSI